MGLISLLAPYRVYFMGAAAAALVFSGWKVRDWQCDASRAAALEAAEKTRSLRQSIVDRNAQEYEAERGQANATTIERTNTIREIYRDAPPVPVDCAPPDAARRLLEDSIRDANADASGELGGEM